MKKMAPRQNFVLDNTLRYLYYTLRQRRALLMAIEFTYGGRTWRAGTKEEAVDLLKYLRQQDPADITSEDESVWTPDTAMELLKSIGTYQKVFLRELYKNPFLMSDDAIKALSLNESGFAGVLSGLSKALKKINLKPWQLYSVEVNWNGKNKTRGFRLQESFRWAVNELGWPENWI